MPAQVTPTHDTAASTSTPLPQVITIQPGKQQAEAGEVSNINPSDLSDQMRAPQHMGVKQKISRLPPNEQHPQPIKEDAGMAV